MQDTRTLIWRYHLAPHGDWERALAESDWLEAQSSGDPSAKWGFLYARSRLRSVLEECTGVPAPRLRFWHGRHGKPSLAPGQGRCVHFNVSHSRRVLLIAVSTTGPVGVDVEEMRAIDAGWLVESWFSPRERRAWSRLPRAERLAGFFHAWCRKEAFMKALGLGMALPFDEFSVSLSPARATLIELRGRDPRPWRLTRIDAGAGRAAALVTYGRPGRIEFREVA